uniref:Si:ch211-229n2.7 n=1 Tax=Astyanax mexicanus TaxID=7994 RepID=A0A3B1JFL7_ASTMX
GRFGDLIEFSYPIGFSHWGMYEGDGHVVHFAVGVFPSSGNILLGQTMIRRELLAQVPVPTGARIKISNSSHDCTASPATDMRRRLYGLLGEVLLYNLLTLNCEHFATFVRYGVAVCNQVSYALPSSYLKNKTTHMCKNTVKCSCYCAADSTSQRQRAEVSNSTVPGDYS